MDVYADVRDVLFADCEWHWADDCAEERELGHEEAEAYCGVSVGVEELWMDGLE